MVGGFIPRRHSASCPCQFMAGRGVLHCRQVAASGGPPAMNLWTGPPSLQPRSSSVQLPAIIGPGIRRPVPSRADDPRSAGPCFLLALGLLGSWGRFSRWSGDPRLAKPRQCGRSVLAVRPGHRRPAVSASRRGRGVGAAAAMVAPRGLVPCPTRATSWPRPGAGASLAIPLGLLAPTAAPVPWGACCLFDRSPLQRSLRGFAIHGGRDRLGGCY
jgi:hypothetical protein